MSDTLDASVGANRQAMPEKRRFAAVVMPADLQNTRLGRGDVSGTLDTARPSRGGGQAVTVPALRASDAKMGARTDATDPFQAVLGGGVRRLTPTEFERLQGFPDGWTCTCGVNPYTTATCRCPDSPRYRALGNAVAVPVVEWLARRLVAVGRGT